MATVFSCFSDPDTDIPAEEEEEKEEEVMLKHIFELTAVVGEPDKNVSTRQ